MFLPQETIEPSVKIAIVWKLPQDTLLIFLPDKTPDVSTAVGTSLFSIVPSPSCPWLFEPHENASPDANKEN